MDVYFDGSCYKNPCSTCNSCNKCGKSCCEHKDDCCCNLHLDWVPHTLAEMSLTDGKCSTKIDLCPGIKACQTVTHMDFNSQTGCIEYQNEKYVYTDGAEGILEKVCVSDFYPFINIYNLNDVEFDDELPGNCYEFIYKKDISCGDNCKSKTDHWENWNVNYPGAKVESMEYIRGANADGCPVYLDKPDNCSLLMFSPSCVAPTGEWQGYQIPDAGDCVMTPDDNGYYKVLKKDDCGCPVECKLPVMPPGMTMLNYQRDSVPDDPDFPWYYGCYNDKINLHLQENAPQYFGKYDLKVTIHYGVQAIKSDRYNFNYNWRSLVVPVVDGGTIEVRYASSILQNWAMSGSFANSTKDVPWGTSSLRGSFSFIVPKGKEAYLHHEFRVITTDVALNDPPYKYSSTYDGKRVPQAETAFNSALWPASRLNALQVIIEPTQGSTDYHPTADAYRDQLDAPVDSYQE